MSKDVKTVECKDCLMREFYPNALCGDTPREITFSDLEEEYERLEPTDVPIEGIKFEGVV